MKKLETALKRGARKENARLGIKVEKEDSTLTSLLISLDRIESAGNVRTSCEGIPELAANIKKYGLQQPITVYPDPKREGRYIVKFGHRRLEALRLLAESAPKKYGRALCIVAGSENVLEDQLIENVMREGISQADLCDGLFELSRDGKTYKEIGILIGKSEKTVRNLFVGINEAKEDSDLYAALCPHMGTSEATNTLREIADTRTILDKEARLALLEERRLGHISYPAMLIKAKELARGKAGPETDATGDAEPSDEGKAAGKGKEAAPSQPIYIWVNPVGRDIRLHMPEGTPEDFTKFTNTLAEYLDWKKGYHLAKGMVAGGK
jgi:ParB/RepB/Spo0J family partition protein